MKKIANRRIVNVFSAIVLLMACPAVMAQTKHNRFYIQPMAGTHISWWHGEMGCYNENTGKMVEFNSKGKMGYTVGLELGYQLSQSFGFSLGTAYTHQTLCTDDVLWSEKHYEQELFYSMW